MKLYILAISYIICTGFKTAANKDTAVELASIPSSIISVTSTELLMKTNIAAKTVLGFSKKRRAIEAYYFPGNSDERALIIGGVHGSELSSVEVARSVIELLENGEKPYYNVIVIPVLFPDNAALAKSKPTLIGSTMNYGRYTNNITADPNRQMPSPGKAFDTIAKDHLGREIETENKLLLELIHIYRPQRIISIHAIRDIARAGIYADPRTDPNGMALGFSYDSSLAIEMAKYIQSNDGYIPGNSLDNSPSALYHCDFPAVPAGYKQPRNFHGSELPNKRGVGISLGSWASTAINDEKKPLLNREAISILTMEFPGYKRPLDYKTLKEQQYFLHLIRLYASAIEHIFLERIF
jgi:hypothetical protein